MAGERAYRLIATNDPTDHHVPWNVEIFNTAGELVSRHYGMTREDVIEEGRKAVRALSVGAEPPSEIWVDSEGQDAADVA